MRKTKQQVRQEKKLQRNIRQASRDRADRQTTLPGTKPPTRRGGLRPASKKVTATSFSSSLSARFFGRADAPQTVQQSIPYREMYRDGICRVTDRLYTKTIQFFDITYQLAQAEDKTQIFEQWCDWLNYFDSSISFQMSFINQRGNIKEFQQSIDIPDREDDFNSIRREYAEMLKTQLAKGNNGIVKTKYITFGIEADSLKAAKPRIERVEADILNNFKVMGVQAHSLSGIERLSVIHGQFHPDGREKLRFDWRDIPRTGNSTKDYIAPSGFDFRDSRSFRMGEHHGAVSFLQILAPELTDRMLADFLDMLQTKAECTRRILQFDVDRYVALRDVTLISDNTERYYDDFLSVHNVSAATEMPKEFIPLENMNWFIKDELVNRKEQKVLLFQFEAKDPECYLNTDIVSFLISQLQRSFNEYRCEAVWAG